MSQEHVIGLLSAGWAITAVIAVGGWLEARSARAEIKRLFAPFDRDGDGRPGGSLPKAKGQDQ